LESRNLLILGADRIVCSLLRIIRLLQGLLRANEEAEVALLAVEVFVQLIFRANDLR
jgi:hypothetical protein